MNKIPQKCKTVIAVLFFMFSFSTFASDLPDPEVLAKQYLKDLCTLNEKDFVRKYMVTQADAELLINEVTRSYKAMNEDPGDNVSDSLTVRSKVHKVVV